MAHSQGQLNRLETELQAIREAIIENLEEHRRLLEQQRKIINELKGS
jgi:hypothetical protein